MAEKLSLEFRKSLGEFLGYLNKRIDGSVAHSKDFPTEEERGSLRKVRSQLYIAFPELAPGVFYITESGGGMFNDWEKIYLSWDSVKNNWIYHEERVTNESGMMVPFTSTPSHHQHAVGDTPSIISRITGHYGLTKKQVEGFVISKTSPRDLVRILAGELEIPSKESIDASRTSNQL